MIIAFALCLAVVLVVLLRAHREVDHQFIGEWARAHGLTLTAENRPMVDRYLKTARLLRTWGALAGL
ncbi:MAG: hypothetical protein QOI56_1827, partial [Actinomycetota bacterium]|nr:hypothetical protein [Actinomycetota bacterium]